ncbi:hypothetical protein [Roseovarius aestuariivivens]|uniref:hypothetical protein n=1 Tax=Roseovarius aestuariivivens TaxID=1888910 RepID=UPI001080C373|nr:hypothetical protein [Roseovarius aestuariivivens]
MDYTRTPIDTRADATLARSKTAKSLARWVKLALTCAVLTAIWQERALAPQAHDRMKTTVAMAGDWLEKTEGAKSYLTAMSGLSGGSQSEYGPITDALLKMRQ